MHEALSYFVLYSYNFCWAVRTLREGNREQGYQQRTPAMAAKLTDHGGGSKSGYVIQACNASRTPRKNVPLPALWQQDSFKPPSVAPLAQALLPSDGTWFV